MTQSPISPNFGPRRAGGKVDFVMLHYTAMADCDAALRALCDPAREVSAHYLITRKGEIIPLVAEDMRAWHAGAGLWRNCADLNSQSIGIELDNDGASPFAAALMTALEGLLRDLLARYGLGPEAVIAHSDFAPARKIDPGARFDWAGLAHLGLAVMPKEGLAPAPKADADRFLADAAAFGYDATLPLEVVLRAARLRFRPWAQGPLDGRDCAIIADLARRFPQTLCD